MDEFDELSSNDKDKSSSPTQSCENQEEESSYGRNRRVRQKNRYFLDFHCTNLTKGVRSNRDFDFDSSSSLATSSGTGTRSSNRNNNQQTIGPDTFEYKYCRKCNGKMVHDVERGCQACLYKKIVESHKRQTNKSSIQRNNQSASTIKTAPATSTTPPAPASRATNSTSTASTTTNTIADITPAPVTTSRAASGDIKPKLLNDNEILRAQQVSTYSNNIDNITNLDSWTVDEVANYILSKGFVDEAELFKTQSVDGISLLLMQRTDFTYGLKIKLGPALKIYDQVCRLRKEYFNRIVKA